MSKKNNGASNALVQGSILAVASIISRICPVSQCSY
jgi:stage V sporulation protein B